MVVYTDTSLLFIDEATTVRQFDNVIPTRGIVSCQFADVIPTKEILALCVISAYLMSCEASTNSHSVGMFIVTAVQVRLGLIN